jgi:hypothetical protein
MYTGLGHVRGLALACPLTVVLIRPLFESSLASLLRGWTKILFPILRMPIAIEVDVVHLF